MSKAASKSASSASSVASASASSASSVASASLSSASKLAASSASKFSASAGKTSASLAAQATLAGAAASDAYARTSTFSIVITTIAITTTVIAGILAAIYYSGYADDILKAAAKKFYEGKAQAEAMALANTGNEKAQSFLKDQLKKNPVMGESELESVQKGLGGEAVSEGLGGVSSKLGGLGGKLG